MAKIHTLFTNTFINPNKNSEDLREDIDRCPLATAEMLGRNHLVCIRKGRDLVIGTIKAEHGRNFLVSECFVQGNVHWLNVEEIDRGDALYLEGFLNFKRYINLVHASMQGKQSLNARDLNRLSTLSAIFVHP